ncbi:bifunctional proline dehydrogenase/L-glutamate gamma-semialdehyde dehydrogenase PutA [Pseudomonas sp. MYb185]|uniref:bifunctional proline dehydrogenase/L-glutamate gamma-semialdehyde dehydrogenase PutA n=1 Tax=Pseudomonas sp. MYb185 TaxID=1848729 RepID=UPI000CFC6458|nr:bifunctional proline dehydrogenase/L-glutamate gamma-semialdehyde dehydrogenase PutA [Pseudomonas sp. MYb185]PRB78979.1 bifunctional proline dehydrogenase/L-glutamate gamma-semialdehyde dehydrogenase [Pseudomonas sp. MYb185]
MPLPHPLHDQNRQQHGAADDLLHPDLEHQSLQQLARQISQHYMVDENTLMPELIQLLDHQPEHIQRLHERTAELVERVRSQGDAIDSLDQLLQQYSLDTQEGVLLMCLAEALLRVPDSRTAEALIRDKLSVADWKSHLGQSDSLLVNASTWGLILTKRVVKMDPRHDQPVPVFNRLISRLGEPVVRQVMSHAMKLMGHQFVLGRTLPEALANGKPLFKQGYTYSFDMLGEAACTHQDAQRYFSAYLDAIERVGQAGTKVTAAAPAPSISIKLSALHPRYERSQRDRVLKELGNTLGLLVTRARELDVAITLDAEEADRLELSLEVLEQVYRQQAKGWGKLGLVVQAYSKRALPVLHWLTRLATEQGDEIPVRLVKGAYWDTEIKQAQIEGLADYPVYTRKANTDIAYLACARYLLSDLTRGRLFPQFATHNAHTLVCLLDMAGDRPIEFQRLHGMGEALYKQALQLAPAGSYCRIYAPVGAHKDLLPYLVRRLLENGANSSFVHQLVDERVPVAQLCRHPLEVLSGKAAYRNTSIPLPHDLYGPERPNSKGVNLLINSQLDPLLQAMRSWDQHQWQGRPLLAQAADTDAGPSRSVISPFDRRQQVGQIEWTTAEQVQRALDAAALAFPRWNAVAVTERAAKLRRLADLLEMHFAELMALCAREAGKQLSDGVAEIREAVDFCRYYAHQAEQKMGQPIQLPGPTGESNELYLTGRGVFVAISPWNFPVAIFLGQVAAAVVTGNTVLAKPAEQTSLVAHRCIELMYEAGIERDVVQLLPGSGKELGPLLTSDPRVVGVVFTGSTATAWQINLNLAQRQGAPLAALIAETGGQNAMIVDSTALPEQVVADVVESAFASAGQRCSALRVLFLQEDIADKVEELLAGAMQELQLGDPRALATDVGPVIDAQARQKLQAHIEQCRQQDRVLAETSVPDAWRANGEFVAPVALRLDRIDQLEAEHFGPVLHIIRYRATEIDQVIESINRCGYGLTFGIQSRNEGLAADIERRVRIGNVYINRNMIGAVVGVQPFGGMGLSGTGPKAGGPHYLLRFVTEKTRTINTAAIGGNASLLAQGDD